MALLVAIFIGALLVMLAQHYWISVTEGRLASARDEFAFRRWLWRGAVAPAALWLFFNLGLLGEPVWPAVQPLSAGLKTWHQSFNRFSFLSTLVIASFWAGITFLWLLWKVGRDVEERRDFVMTCCTWTILLAPVAGVLLWTGGGGTLGVALMVIGLPLLHMALNLKPQKPAMPSYARAQAKISFGKYDEAEMEVIRELEQFENDFDGWMLLAELYVTQFHDLAGADETVRDLCQQPRTTPVQVSIALHRLADWHLKWGRDPLTARAVLEQICARMPGTHLARMARQRIDQLPATREELEQREAGKPVHLPRVPDELEPTPPRLLTREQALAEANQWVQTLQQDPDNIGARESFARVLTENLGDVTNGIEQLHLLLALPNQSGEQRARWLLTIAAWHFRFANDAERARLVYEQVARDFPNTPHAFAAQRRLHLLRMPSRPRRANSTFATPSARVS